MKLRINVLEEVVFQDVLSPLKTEGGAESRMMSNKKLEGKDSACHVARLWPLCTQTHADTDAHEL